MSLDIEETRTFSKLRSMQSEWESILRESDEDEIFLTQGWLMSWWRTYGERRDMMVLTAEEDGELVGYAPLMVSSRGTVLPWRKVEFIGSGPSDRCGIVAKEGRGDVHRALWDHLSERGGWDMIELRDVRGDGPTAQNLMFMYPEAEFVATGSPKISIEGNYAKYLSGLSKSMRTNLSRYSRKLLEEMNVRFVVRRRKSEVEEGVRILRELSDARWDSMNVLSTPGMVDFISRAVKVLSADGHVVFHTLEHEGEPIAITLGFEYRGKYLYYLSGFDTEYSKLSPGSVLLSKIIEECHERKLSEVDLLRGNEPYKYKFNAVDRPHLHFRKIRPGLIRVAECSIREQPLS